MKSGLNVGNLFVADAFRSALRHQLFIVGAIFVLLWLARLIAVSLWPGPLTSAGLAGTPERDREPAGRQLLRIGFGLLWVFDGILQGQAAMPLGLPSQVTEPSTAGSPGWVRHLVDWASSIWTYHPVQMAAAAVWIQVGIGLWLLFAKRGWWSRFGGLAGAGWGLVVWVFGESFGGLFAPGLTWLFGAPGAAVLYCAAGALLALPPSAWSDPRFGRRILAGMGVFFVGMAVLQAWPGRGFWQGRIHGQDGPLTGMVRSMAQTPQPHVLARLVSDFAGFVAAHGFAVNLFVVIALAGLGAAFLSGRPGITRAAVIAAVVLCLADWVLIEDVGFFGGLGTDPNSMIPMALLIVAGYLVLAGVPGLRLLPAARQSAAGPVPETAQAATPPKPEPAQPEPASPGPAAPEPAPLGGRGRLRSLPQSVLRGVAMASGRSVTAAGALAVVLVGVLPSVAASANPNADPIIAQALNGSSDVVNYQAAGFSLTDQDGAPVSLAGLHGKVVLLTFLDPVCTSDCPLIGHEFAAAGRLLSAESSRVQLVAIVASTTYRSAAVMRAYDQQEGLSALPDWLFLTGTLSQLRTVWHRYAVAVQTLPAGAMTLHSDIAYVIDAAGHVRQVLNMDPGPGTAVSQSSFAVQLAGAARQELSPR
jgi:cytochrome oxidase Cu insertion factor (SCO1/SenC/PrrC family)